MNISWNHEKVGFVRAAIAQIPLWKSHFRYRRLQAFIRSVPIRLQAMAVSTSVRLMNMVGCWFGTMPVCDGACGLA
ncbi:hypothetical protein ZOSMA_296G00030 [Zostera marina]|uniref:Uncharacterized protein n=1 Tax=Zostera marina TaxID=29655 RepID=A0A0K9PE79_ZOSMR|nr:hypothetical protein ZOSMA_296G00030 [Zostera marina]